MTTPSNIDKAALKIYVKMSDGQRLLGLFYLEPNERLQDVMNDKRSFLPLHALGDNNKHKMVMLSKRFIQQVEEADSKSSEMNSADRRALDDRRSGDRRGTGGSLELA